MASIVSSTKRLARHPSTHRVGWIVALGAAAAAVVGAAVYFGEKSTSAAPAGPSWTLLQPTAGASGAQVTIPANTPFAFSDVGSDPQLQSLVSQLNQLVSSGSVLQSQGFQAGTAAPAGFPADGLGTSAYRATGTVGNVSGGVAINVTQTSKVWIQQQPAPSPTDYLAVISDPATVKQYQNIFAQAIAQSPGGLVIGPTGSTPLTTSDYAATDVDGNAANPKWVKVLSAFQQDVDSQPFSNTPAGFPSKLRTDGVLDYATALVIQNA